MPLTLTSPGTQSVIRKVNGTPEQKRHLEDLGFIAGGIVTVISTLGGNLVVNVKESRVALSRELAAKILV